MGLIRMWNIVAAWWRDLGNEYQAPCSPGEVWLEEEMSEGGMPRPNRVERLIETNGTELVRKLWAIDKPGPQVIQVAGRDVRVVPLRRFGCVLVKTEAPEVALH